MSLTGAELRHVVDVWLVDVLERDEFERRNGLSEEAKAFWDTEKDDDGNITDKGYSETVIQEIKDAFQTNDFSPSHDDGVFSESPDININPSGGVYHLKAFVDNVIATQKLDIIYPSPAYTELTREMAKGYQLFLRAGQYRSEGNYHEADKLIQEHMSLSSSQYPASVPTPAKAQNTQEQEKEDLSLGTSILLKDFIKKYEKEKLSQMRVKNTGGIIADLQQLLHDVGNIPLHTIPLDKVRTFRNTMYCVPVNWKKRKQYKNIPFAKLPSLKLTPEQCIDVTTAYKRVSAIRAAFKWAQTEGYRIPLTLPTVVAGKKPHKDIAPQDRRNALDADDIRQICLHKGYTEDAFEFPFQFWLPLLALYTGAREKELCQLNPQTDIRQTTSGIWYLDLNREKGKHIKTEAGVRSVPLHQQLIDIGFIQFVEKQKEQGLTLLFPELLNKRKDEEINAKASRWFNGDFKGKIGITSVRRKTSRDQVKKDFHSFRHHFATYCKTHGIEEAKYQECIGHESDTSVTALYSGKFGVDILYRDVISKLNFVEDYSLNLANLHSSKWAKGE